MAVLLTAETTQCSTDLRHRGGILESDSLLAVYFTAFLRTEEMGNAHFL